MKKILLSVLIIGLIALPLSAEAFSFSDLFNFSKNTSTVQANQTVSISELNNKLSSVDASMQNALINIITIFLGLAVGSKLSAAKFLTPETLKILVLGILAFGLATAAGVIMAKIMNIFSKTKINPLIGAAGVSAVPMAARVANKVGLEANPQNFLLMHAM